MVRITAPAADRSRQAGPETEKVSHAVLIWVALRTHFREMIRVARIVRQDPEKRPWIVFARWYEFVEEDIATCRAEGISYLGFSPVSVVPQVWEQPSETPTPVSTETPAPEAAAAPPAQPDVSADQPAAVVEPSRPGFLRRCLGAVRRTLFRPLRGLLSWETRNYLRECWKNGLTRCLVTPMRKLLKQMLPYTTRRLIRSSQDHFIRFGNFLCLLGRNLRMSALAIVRGRPRTLAHWRQLLRIGQFCNEYTYARHFWSYRLQEVEVQLDRIRPSLIVLPEDNVEYPTAVLVRAGHARGIPSVILPFTIGNKREAAESNHHLPKFRADTLYSRMLLSRFPGWKHTHKGIDLVRLPAAEALHLEEIGAVPADPWVLHNGAADMVLLESEAARKRALDDGLAPERLAVIGSPRLDDLARVGRFAQWRRSALESRLGLPDRPRLILCALPPDQGVATRPGCEFTAYPDLVRFILDTLKRQPDCNLIVNPHPRCPRGFPERLAEQGVCVLQGDIANLIPLCDLYVASASATIPMALACGKPVVNYDVYQYGYEDFASSERVRTVYSRTAFEEALRLALTTPPPPDDSAEWGVIDGLVGDRMLNIFNRLIAGADPRSIGEDWPTSPTEIPELTQRSQQTAAV